MAFWKETPVEDWPTTETRFIELRQGVQTPVTANWLVWEYYDWLIETNRITEERLVALTIRDAEEMNRSFEESFAAGCIYFGRMEIEVLAMFKPQIERRLAYLQRRMREL